MPDRVVRHTLAVAAIACAASLSGVGAVAAAEAAPFEARVSVEPVVATVGDPILVRIEIVPTENAPRFEPLPDAWGDFRVLDGAWRAPGVEAAPDAAEGGEAGPVWIGRVAAYRTGDLELPAIDLATTEPSPAGVVRTEPVAIRIDSVLPSEEEEAPPLADLKPQASLAPDYTAVLVALGAVLALLAIAVAIRAWMIRRAARATVVPPPPDPFERESPDAWMFRRLQQLLDRRLHETGEVDRFFEELGVLVKRYLSGRYRVDLMERTSEEVPDALEQAGADAAGIRAAVELLARCDAVKFARERPGPAACRSAVEAAYALVDVTRPAPETGGAADAMRATPDAGAA